MCSKGKTPLAKRVGAGSDGDNIIGGPEVSSLLQHSTVPNANIFGLPRNRANFVPGTKLLDFNDIVSY